MEGVLRGGRRGRGWGQGAVLCVCLTPRPRHISGRIYNGRRTHEGIEGILETVLRKSSLFKPVLPKEKKCKPGFIIFTSIGECSSKTHLFQGGRDLFLDRSI